MSEIIILPTPTPELIGKSIDFDEHCLGKRGYPSKVMLINYSVLPFGKSYKHANMKAIHAYDM